MNQNLTDRVGSLPILNLKGTTRKTDSKAGESCDRAQK